MKLQDERGALTVAERRGREAGHKAGLKESIAEGEKAARLATARALLADGVEAALVAKYTGLSLAEVTQL